MSFAEMPLDEAIECVTRYLGGERLAFDPVYHFYKNQLLQVARKYHRDLSTAEDAVQAAIEKGVVNLATWQRERPIGFWLRSICARVCLTELERQKRAPVPADGAVIDSGRLSANEPLRFAADAGGEVRAESRPPGAARVDPDAIQAAPVLRTEREWMTRLLEEARRREALSALLARLSQEENRIVVLFHLENRTHDEIAGRLGITSATCRKKLERALRKLRVVADPALHRAVEELT